MSSGRAVGRTPMWCRTPGGGTIAAGLWVGLLLTLGACGLGGPAHEPPPDDVAAVVEMTNGLSFSPGEVTVPAGGIVEWRNTSFFTHTATADPRRATAPDHVRLPPGAEPFDSGEVPAGEVFRHRFETPGTYRYFCIPHEGQGMVGTIVVEPAT